MRQNLHPNLVRSLGYILLVEVLIFKAGTNTNQYKPIRYRLSAIYRQYNIAGIVFKFKITSFM